MKLKTLKDLEEASESASDAVWVEDLKAEAIKWVKKKQKESPDFWFNECEMMIEFHNITEEDLK